VSHGLRLCAAGVRWLVRLVCWGVQQHQLNHLARSRGYVALAGLSVSPPRLIGFGDATLYLVRIDEVDLQYLEKCRLP
jgi:hypothetical protein